MPDGVKVGQRRVRAGKTPCKIIKFFEYPKSTVDDIVQRYAASEVATLIAVLSEGNVMPPHFFKKGEMVIPDLNPFDYYVWGVFERVTNKTRHPNVVNLQATKAFTKMDRAQLQTACSCFRNRIEAVIEAQSGYIE
ncbi:uncharacterized protein LOC116852458 [Odontomachus brunneus]|uniref:uncharacterized protein LOC116852458 n=1 Tax=Odontomachus brunneus TaxID=486640 RepID=UPI0013F28B4A|nr:uncharacterized protein LOC116852458 [Odontomachus brunneus]